MGENTLSRYPANVKKLVGASNWTEYWTKTIWDVEQGGRKAGNKACNCMSAISEFSDGWQSCPVEDCECVYHDSKFFATFTVKNAHTIKGLHCRKRGIRIDYFRKSKIASRRQHTTAHFQSVYGRLHGFVLSDAIISGGCNCFETVT